jgi:hypothetical protein
MKKYIAGGNSMTDFIETPENEQLVGIDEYVDELNYLLTEIKKFSASAPAPSKVIETKVESSKKHNSPLDRYSETT